VSQSDDVTKLRDILAFKKIASPAFCPVKGELRCDATKQSSHVGEDWRQSMHR